MIWRCIESTVTYHMYNWHGQQYNVAITVVCLYILLICTLLVFFTAFSDDHQLSDPSSASLSCPSIEKFTGDFLYFIFSYMTVYSHSTFFSKAFLKRVVIAKVLLLQQVLKQWLCEGGRSPCNIYLYNIPLLPKNVSCS